MSDSTGIEWTDATWNPTRGCSRVSEGCRNCYAETMAARFSGPGAPYQGLTRDGKWTGKIALAEDKLVEPLHWKKPRKIFVNSMSDLFHEGVPDEFVDRVFAVMALCPQHTFQVLTKRPERMRAYFADPVERALAIARTQPDDRIAGTMADSLTGGLPNVWLGVSVEDQATADKRIPELLRTPAAVRFVSYEPALGPVVFDRWPAEGGVPFAPTEKWSSVAWPDWVPKPLREMIAQDYECRRESPKDWWKHVTTHYHREGRPGPEHPPLGARVGVDRTDSVVPALSSEAVKRGRYVPCWGNIGRIVLDDGTVGFCSSSIGPGWLSKHLQGGDYRHLLHWIICGGESGPGARACDVAWVRSVVAQCEAAGVACFVKQLGARPYSGGDTYAHQAATAINYRDRKGGDPREWPADLRVRAFPAAQKRA